MVKNAIRKKFITGNVGCFSDSLEYKKAALLISLKEDKKEENIVSNDSY